jgi:TonB family protein
MKNAIEVCSLLLGSTICLGQTPGQIVVPRESRMAVPRQEPEMGPGQKPLKSAYELREECQTNPRSVDEALKLGSCLGYIEGFMESYEGSFVGGQFYQFHIDKSLTVVQIQEMFIKYLDDEIPQELHSPASIVLSNMLHRYQKANWTPVNPPAGKYVGDARDLGLGERQMNARVEPEILSDTMGVDFGPYLEIVKREVKRNWYNLIPESVLLKKSVVSLQFSIMKNGQVAGLQSVSGSGDVSLDRAAYGGITASDPFPPLPTEFTGPNLTLRFTFFYNLNTDGTPLQ